MRAWVAFLACTALAVTALAISSEPVYIKGYEGASAVVSQVESVKTELKGIKPEPKLKPVLGKLEPLLGDLVKKCSSFKDKPVDVTREYRGVATLADDLKPLLREHVLLARLADLLGKIEAASK